MESAMTSREMSEVFIPSVPMVMPSEITTVLNSRGVPPAWRMPALTCSARRRRPKLQGPNSVQVLAMPMRGLRRASASKPAARYMARAPARDGPWVMCLLMGVELVMACAFYGRLRMNCGSSKSERYNINHFWAEEQKPAGVASELCPVNWGRNLAAGLCCTLLWMLFRSTFIAVAVLPFAFHKEVVMHQLLSSVAFLCLLALPLAAQEEALHGTWEGTITR